MFTKNSPEIFLESKYKNICFNLLKIDLKSLLKNRVKKLTKNSSFLQIRAIFSIPPEIMSQFTNKNMGKNIFFYFFILVTSSLGFMHPRVVFLKSRYLTKDVTFKSHMEKDTDFSVKLVKILKNFIERKISEIPRVRTISFHTLNEIQFTYLYEIFTFHS